MNFRLVALLFLSLFVVNAESSVLKQKVLVVSFDGFALHYLKAGHKLPAFDRLRRESTFTEAVESVFPSETHPNHFAMATGLFPDSHGIVSNVFYDPKEDFYFNAMGYGSKADVETAMWWSAEPMWITARRHGLVTGSSCWPGDRIAYPPGELKSNFFRNDFTMDVPFEDRIDEAVGWLTQSGADLVYMYSFQPDSTGHRFGTKGPEMKQTLEKVDGQLDYLFKALEKAKLTSENLNLIICSDHGMANLEKEVIFEEHLNTTELFERTTRFGANVPIWPKRGREQEIIDELEKIAAKFGNIFKPYRTVDLPKRFHYGASPRVPPIIAIGEIGAFLTETRRFSLKQIRVTAGHGYDPAHYSMKPIFFARGPAFKQNFNATHLTTNMKTKDVYAVVAELIGLKFPPPTNASYAVVEGLFRDDYTFLTVKDLRKHSASEGSSYFQCSAGSLIFVCSIVLAFKKTFIDA